MLIPGRRLPFGDGVIGRAFDLRPGERKSIVPAAAAAREIAAADPSSVVHLYDALSGFRRYSPPTPDDVDHARRSIGGALARGDFVLLRRERRLRGPIVLPPGFISEPPPPPAPPPVEEKTSWFEVTVVDTWGQPLDNVALVFSAAGDRRDLTTNGAGTSRVEGVAASHASVRIASSSELRKELRDRAASATAPLAKRGDDTSLVVVDRDDLVASLEAETPRTMVVTVPLTRVRLVGMHFDTNKAFLRETAMRGIRKVVQVYKENPEGKLLVVGHTDTVADEKYNLDLSVERAESVKAYLKDDVAAWESWFGHDKPAQKRWGDIEIDHMISALPCEQSVSGFQQFSNDTRGTSLVVDGVAGPKTRRALIEAYMALEGTTLPDAIDAIVHGCGEFFPEDPTADNVEDAENRRVEIFCFHDEITPPVPGKKAKRGEPEYPIWKKQVTRTIDFEGADGKAAAIVANVRSLTFRSDHVDASGKKVIRPAAKLRFGDAESEFSKPEWRSDREECFPISQSIDTRVVVDVEIELALKGASSAKLSRVIGECSITTGSPAAKIPIDSLSFDFTPDAPMDVTTGRVTIPGLAAKAKLSKAPAILELIDINWSLTIDDETVPTGTTGRHTVYVTYRAPRGAMFDGNDGTPLPIGPVQDATEDRLRLALHGVEGIDSTDEKTRIRGMFDFYDSQGVNYVLGHRYNKGKGFVPPQSFHDYLWRILGRLEEGECDICAASFILACGMVESMASGWSAICFRGRGGIRACRRRSAPTRRAASSTSPTVARTISRWTFRPSSITGRRKLPSWTAPDN